jgi:membrane-associated protease RseP (regulator of RpoE activity)
MRSMGSKKPVAFLGLALLALGLVAAAPRVSRAADTPWLGVTLQSLNDGLRDGMGYDGEGVLVSRVLQGSPADRAGLRKGDVIVSLNGRSAESPEQLTRLVRDARVGQTVALVVVRDGDRRALSARLASRPEDADLPDDEGNRIQIHEDHGDMDQGDLDHHDMDDHGDKDRDDHDMDDSKDFQHPKDLEDLKEKGFGDMGRFPMDGGRSFTMNMGRGRLGVRTEDLSADLAPYFEAPGGSGALVMEVLKDTPAERAGLKAGDVIVRFGDQRISGADDLIRSVREAPAGRVSLTVLRHGSRRTLEPELEAAPRWGNSRGGPMSFGPGNGRVIIRDRNGTRVYRDQNGDKRDEEMQQLREEVRRLRQELNEKDKDEDNDNDDDGN